MASPAPTVVVLRPMVSVPSTSMWRCVVRERPWWNKRGPERRLHGTALAVRVKALGIAPGDDLLQLVRKPGCLLRRGPDPDHDVFGVHPGGLAGSAEVEVRVGQRLESGTNDRGVATVTDDVRVQHRLSRLGTGGGLGCCVRRFVTAGSRGVVLLEVHPVSNVFDDTVERLPNHLAELGRLVNDDPAAA